jgi:hypothetical protein
MVGHVRLKGLLLTVHVLPMPLEINANTLSVHEEGAAMVAPVAKYLIRKGDVNALKGIRDPDAKVCTNNLSFFKSYYYQLNMKCFKKNDLHCIWLFYFLFIQIIISQLL